MQKHYRNWQYFTLLGLVILSIIYALPNIYGDDPTIAIKNKAHQAIPSSTFDGIRKLLYKHTITVKAIDQGHRQALIRFHTSDDQIKARDLLERDYSENYDLGLMLAPQTPRWLQWLGAEPMKLGLDLRGGLHLLLDVDIESVMQSHHDAAIKNLTTQLRKNRIRYRDLSSSTSTIKLLISHKDYDRFMKQLGDISPDYDRVNNPSSTHSGKWQQVALQIKPQIRKQIKSYTLDQTITILNNRINELGLSEASIQRQGSRQIAVDLPGVQDSNRAKAILGKTATLRFQMVETKHDAQAASTSGIIPVGSQLHLYKGMVPILLESQPILTGSAITFATATMQEGRPAVSIRLGGGNESLFHQTTASNVGKSMAVVYVETQLKKALIDGKMQWKRQRHEKIISVATIQSALGNQFVISNLQNMDYAENLALLLRSGALQAPVNIVQELTIGSTLGPANIAKGIQSLAIGSLLVILFMAAYYRMVGLIANLALVVNVLLIMAILSIMGATLTLPGIAGMVLTVGMAVDANVLINERIREEIRAGVSDLMAVKAGYERAFATIVDANVTTLIVALILFALGSGTVKGFAVTLTIGLLASMLTAVCLTRAIIDLYMGLSRKKQLSIGMVHRPEKGA